mmetsp:Transcript_59379/g.154339  ORF Transcript_59379/g.154339 Transcript_59379/m.154339 type:complete len:370 (-) Transcript_59379:847-1956(-)
MHLRRRPCARIHLPPVHRARGHARHLALSGGQAPHREGHARCGRVCEHHRGSLERVVHLSVVVRRHTSGLLLASRRPQRLRAQQPLDPLLREWRAHRHARRRGLRGANRPSPLRRVLRVPLLEVPGAHQQHTLPGPQASAVRAVPLHQVQAREVLLRSRAVAAQHLDLLRARVLHEDGAPGCASHGRAVDVHAVPAGPSSVAVRRDEHDRRGPVGDPGARADVRVAREQRAGGPKAHPAAELRHSRHLRVALPRRFVRRRLPLLPEDALLPPLHLPPQGRRSRSGSAPQDAPAGVEQQQRLRRLRRPAEPRQLVRHREVERGGARRVPHARHPDAPVVRRRDRHGLPDGQSARDGDLDGHLPASGGLAD